MASNKHASIRYRVLDKCFANPVKKYFIADLIAVCTAALKEIDPDSEGISLRTIQNDIIHMESAEGFNAPIGRHKDGKKVYYRYEEKDFSIDKQPLNQAELEQIKAAMQVLSHFKGMPQFEWLNDLKPKMENALLLEQHNSPIISFDTNQYLTGIEHLSELFYAILYKKPLCISYQSYKNEEPTKQLLHPYHLKQYNNRWFLLGLNHTYNTITNLALDRIKSIEEEPIPYVATDINFEEYFDDIIGVSLLDGKNKEKIILKFSPSSAPYVLSKPLHHSQKKISYIDGELIISIEVIPNYELESLILSFGERVEVLTPNGFRDKIAERLEMNTAIYK
ncbi:helix-turn-helix transcriptional regulator [Pedobacter cryotolerans]|uniref:WYL domain-containing protein n=1 Tax=Pedobacter cryotolerans TaxID=2571270 RepID=A0A4U1C9X0_9SPHI|nr:WYL domain-containing protein [Pedobacter cryotolerans]TKC02638.1 WYL domain-containing protein [Pedobacter cryotolerans]